LIRSFIKEYAPKSIFKILKSIYDLYRRSSNPITRRVTSGFTTHYDFLGKLVIWCPGSQNWWRYPELTIKNTNLYPELLAKIQSYVDQNDTKEWEEGVSSSYGLRNPALTENLWKIFREHGSDKSTVNDYYLIYSDFIDRLKNKGPLRILEIGLGTNNPKLVSSMGPSGRPGASLRAFRDALPEARVYGADIDTDILFTEERIVTAAVDQLDLPSFDRMCESFDDQVFDIIIDDGLHAVSANMGTLIFGLSHISEGGVIVIEDISLDAIIAWRPVLNILSKDYTCGVVECKSACIGHL